MNWFGETFRKVHILYVSPRWAKRRGEGFDAETYAESLKQAGVDCVELYVKDHHGNVYYPSNTGIPYPRDVLGELLPELKKRDIRLIAYVSICFDNHALGLHPEWRAVTNHGDPQKFPPFYMACLNTPYKDFVVEQIREIAENYEVDGFWLDIMPLARDVPQMFITHFLPAPCFCLSCQRKYEAQTGEPLRRNSGPEQEERAFQYLTGVVESFLAEAREVIHRYRPDAIVTYNSAGSPADPIDSADLTSIEGHAPNYVRQSFIARWAKQRSKPFELLMPGALSGWNGFDQKPAPILRLETGIATAHGGSSVVGQAPYTDGSIDPGQFDVIGKVFHEIREIEPWCVSPEGVSDVGLVLANKPRRASRLWFQMMDGAEVFHEALVDAHVQFDIVRPDADLSAYPVLVLPDQAALSDEEIDTIRAYVERGGRLVASGESSLYDADGARRDDFGLADVFGVSYVQDAPHTYTYLRILPGTLAECVTTVPIVMRQPPSLEVTLDGGELLGEMLYPEVFRTDATTVLWGSPGPDEDEVHPGIVRNTYGDGVSLYVAAPLRPGGLPKAWSADIWRTISLAQGLREFPFAWTKRLASELTLSLISQPVLKTTAPPGVEVVLNRQDGRYILHLVNYHAGDPQRMSYSAHEIGLQGLEVQIALDRLKLDTVRRVYSPITGEAAYETEGNWLTIAVPPLHVHSLFVIE
jgi:hypothetical protein